MRFANRFYDPERQRLLADIAAMLVAVSLPWSVSATSILVVLWLLALLPLLSTNRILEEISTPAGGLAVLLVAFAALGMLWADVSLLDRWHGFDSFPKLLVIPALFVQFRHSARASWILSGFLASCVVLLLGSFIAICTPNGILFGLANNYGVIVKDYIAQSGEFLVCAFALFYAAIDAARKRQWGRAGGMSLLALAFLANIFYVASGRTAIVIMPILLLWLGFRQFGWKGVAAAIFAGVILAGSVWSSSPYMRKRVGGIFAEVTEYRADNADTSAGERLEFLKKSFRFVSEAPLIGHGTGSIEEMFRRAARGDTGASSVIAVNPHNQTFGVAIQLGIVGAIILWAMWTAHLLLFQRPGLVTWIGLVIVVQNVVGSLFNSHLFDFTQGWIYVFGVGAAGAIALRQADAEGEASRLKSAAIAR